MDVTSADGTTIAFDRTGEGPAVILVQGGFSDRSHPIWTGMAAALSPHFTVYNYDRRGRGDSGDTQPYAVEREIEDLEAIIKHAGGEAMVFGGSSGGALALEAAAHGLPITKLAVYEPPYIVDDSRAPVPHDFEAQLADLISEGRRGDVVARFMTEAAEVPAEMVDQMRQSPYWEGMEAVAHTLVYEAAVVGPGNKLPAERLTRVNTPTVVMTGENSAPWMGKGGAAVAEKLPNGEHRILEGQAHDASPEVLGPAVAEFFKAG
ncbi:alpha/beta fold hydrolase [Streptosporangium sandarakinum]|uniref:alpha/beta fold hydrolase n=1 Tax=Streptosporangium sandarakinum TaxID=1260955 RepID=UPI0033AA3BCC